MDRKLLEKYVLSETEKERKNAIAKLKEKNYWNV